jgi:hypothetical protein
MVVRSLEQWLSLATRKLAPASIEQVRREIGEHYQSALDACTWDLASLGSPRKANREYRKVLLTRSEARFLKNGFFLPGSWTWWMSAVVGLLAVLASAASWAVTGHSDLGRLALLIGALLLVQYSGPLLPIKTPARLRTWRIVRSTAFVMAILLLISIWDWAIFAMLTQFCAVWIFQETAAGIRHKLPMERWPDGLYC